MPLPGYAAVAEYILRGVCTSPLTSTLLKAGCCGWRQLGQPLKSGSWELPAAALHSHPHPSVLAMLLHGPRCALVLTAFLCSPWSGVLLSEAPAPCLTSLAFGPISHCRKMQVNHTGAWLNGCGQCCHASLAFQSDCEEHLCQPSCLFSCPSCPLLSK